MYATESTPFRILTVKSSIRGIGWKSEYLPVLQELMSKVNTITTHAYASSKHIFLSELGRNDTFNLNQLISQDFFVEVFLSLIDRTTTTRATDKTLSYRQLIDKYSNEYAAMSGLPHIQLPYAQQVALYEAKKDLYIIYKQCKAQIR